MSHQIQFVDSQEALTGIQSLHVIGRAHRLETATSLVPPSVAATWPDMLKGDPGDHGRTATTWVADSDLKRVTLGQLPEVCSRHNSPARAWAYPRLLSGNRSLNAGVIVLLDDASHARAAAAAVARCLPTFTARSSVKASHTRVLLLAPDGPVSDDSLQILAEGVQAAAHLVDMPPDKLSPNGFVDACKGVADRTGAALHIVRNEELVGQGLGGLHAVGKGATESPALVVLDWAPEGAGRPMVWVGKGITYDTGGLSIKSKTGMPGMKTDMGGAAAVLAAFEAAVRMRVHRRLTAILCIAENAVGPDALRPDDVITMFSGRTVEVNNTDAEGRLVLADGVAWAVRNRAPSVLVDLATLTGAQGVATGKLHAALYCNNDALERAAVEIGRQSGDLTHPVPYAPELFRKEFASSIADMRNSVKDRGNAQVSCAGQFIGNHLGSFDGSWLHVDMASPSNVGYRGTGYGVALLLGLVQHG